MNVCMYGCMYMYAALEISSCFNFYFFPLRPGDKTIKLGRRKKSDSCNTGSNDLNCRCVNQLLLCNQTTISIDVSKAFCFLTACLPQRKVSLETQSFSLKRTRLQFFIPFHCRKKKINVGTFRFIKCTSYTCRQLLVRLNLFL